MRSDKSMADYDKKMRVESAVEWIDELIAQHERGAAELRQQRFRFIEATKDGNTTPVTVLGWVVNAVQNIQRNLRLDLAPNHAAALATIDFGASDRPARRAYQGDPAAEGLAAVKADDAAAAKKAPRLSAKERRFDAQYEAALCTIEAENRRRAARKESK